MRNRETLRKIWIVIGVVMILGMIAMTIAPAFIY